MSWNPFAKKMKNIETPPPIVRIDGVQRGVDGVLRYRVKEINDNQEQLENQIADLRKQLDYLQDNRISYQHVDMRDLHPEFRMGFWDEEQLVRRQLFRSYNNCPSCGAPLNPAKDECEYCKTYCRFDKVYFTEVPEIDRPASL